MSQLILLNEAFERGDKHAFPENLLPGANNIMQATGRLVTAAQEHAACTDDEVINSILTDDYSLVVKCDPIFFFSRTCHLRHVHGQLL